MQMETEIIKKIKDHQSIIIQTHANPDGDATGSSYGLYLVLKHSFPEKNIYVIGDKTTISLDASFDNVDDLIFPRSLVVITDVAVDKLLDDHRYSNSECVICIDHHNNNCELLKCDIFYKDTSYISACGLITNMIIGWDLKIPSNAATFLLLGLITDSGRFLYMDNTNAQRTLFCAMALIEYKAQIRDIYNVIYVEPLSKKMLRNKFLKFKIFNGKVAYRYNKYSIWSKYTNNLFFISRETVNNMQGIIEIPIWVNFTQKEDMTIVAEIRSRDIVVVDIAKKYGGGGHNFACGATLNNESEIKKMLKDLRRLI